jgi:DNA repair protein RadD
VITLRDYQEICITGVRRSYELGHKSPLLVAPTGAGKTVMFSWMAHNTTAEKNEMMISPGNGFTVGGSGIKKQKQALIMAHRKELITQCGNKLMQNGVDFGYINPNFTPDYTRNVQVGTIQSIKPRMRKIPFSVFNPVLTVIDEGHRATSKDYRDIFEHYSKSRRLGVTATPIRMDGTPLSDIYDDLVLGPSVGELINRGYLVKPITSRPAQMIDLSRLDELADEPTQKQLEEIVDRDAITGNAVDHYTKTCPGVAAVVFCVSVKHAYHVAEQFCLAGYKFVPVDGKMKDAERDAILERLACGEIDGITTVDLVTEGFDAPVLQCAIMLRPTRSLSRYIQMAGRVLRLHPGKRCAWILDHVGLKNRFGGVETDRKWVLNQSQVASIKSQDEVKEKKARQVKLKECPVCRLFNEANSKECECGYFFEVRSREVDTIDGELIDEDVTEGSDLNLNFLDVDDLMIKLRAMEKKRGYRKGWADDIYQEWQEKYF